MQFYPVSLKDWTDVITGSLMTLFAVFGGGWALYQYYKSTRLRAAETLLKLEEEFRIVFPTYAEMEDSGSYEESVKPVLIAEKQNTLDGLGLAKLTQLDRCLRFLYLCSVVNDVLGVDRALGVKGGVLRNAYYYYIGILLPGENTSRAELVDYTNRYYPLLTQWVKGNEQALKALREPSTNRK